MRFQGFPAFPGEGKFFLQLDPDFGGVKLHAYQTGDPLADEVFLVEKAGTFVAIESPCFTSSVAALNECACRPR